MPASFPSLVSRQSPRPQAWVHTVYELLSLLSLRMAHAYR